MLMAEELWMLMPKYLELLEQSRNPNLLTTLNANGRRTNNGEEQWKWSSRKWEEEQREKSGEKRVSKISKINFCFEKITRGACALEGRALTVDICTFARTYIPCKVHTFVTVKFSSMCMYMYVCVCTCMRARVGTHPYVCKKILFSVIFVCYF